MSNQFSMILYYFKRKLGEKLTEKRELESLVQDKSKQIENLRKSLVEVSKEIEDLNNKKAKFVQNRHNRRIVKWTLLLYFLILSLLVYSFNIKGYNGIASLGVAIIGFLIITLYKISKILKKENKELLDEYGEDETLEKIEEQIRIKEKEREKNEELMQIGIKERLEFETDLNLVKISIETLQQKMELTKDAFFVNMHSEYVKSDILPMEELKDALLAADEREERKKADILTRIKSNN